MLKAYNIDMYSYNIHIFRKLNKNICFYLDIHHKELSAYKGKTKIWTYKIPFFMNIKCLFVRPTF